MRRLVKLGWALPAMLALLAGCGGGSSASSDQTAKFKSGLSSAADQIGKTAQEIGRDIQTSPSKTDAQLNTEFRQLATRWQSELSQLQTLKPPAKQATDFNSFTGATARVEADLTATAVAAGTHSKAAAEQAGGNLVADILAAKSAATKLTQQLGIK